MTERLSYDTRRSIERAFDELEARYEDFMQEIEREEQRDLMAKQERNRRRNLRRRLARRKQ